VSVRSGRPRWSWFTNIEQPLHTISTSRIDRSRKMSECSHRTTQLVRGRSRNPVSRNWSHHESPTDLQSWRERRNPFHRHLAPIMNGGSAITSLKQSEALPHKIAAGVGQSPEQSAGSSLSIILCSSFVGRWMIRSFAGMRVSRGSSADVRAHHRLFPSSPGGAPDRSPNSKTPAPTSPAHRVQIDRLQSTATQQNAPGDVTDRVAGVSPLQHVEHVFTVR
jgi:hypothetical protein